MFPDALLEWGLLSYLVVAVLVAVQGQPITILAGFAASRGIMDLSGVIIAAIIGNSLADMGWYTLGYLGRFERLMTRFPLLRKYEEKINVFQGEMQQQAVKILVITKMSTTMVIPALVAAGMARVPFFRWFPLLLIIEIIWTSAVAVAGYLFGERIAELETGLQLIASIGAIISAVVIIWFMRRLFKQAF